MAMSRRAHASTEDPYPLNILAPNFVTWLPRLCMLRISVEHSRPEFRYMLWVGYLGGSLKWRGIACAALWHEHEAQVLIICQDTRGTNIERLLDV